MANPQQPAATAQPASGADDADFKKAIQLHTSAGYRNFLAAHANSPHAADVRQRLASCQMVGMGGPVFQKLHPLAREERCR